MLSQTALRTIASPQGVRLLLLEKLDITQSYKMRRRVITRPFALRGCCQLLTPSLPRYPAPHPSVCLRPRLRLGTRPQTPPPAVCRRCTRARRWAVTSRSDPEDRAGGASGVAQEKNPCSFKQAIDQQRVTKHLVRHGLFCKSCLAKQACDFQIVKKNLVRAQCCHAIVAGDLLKNELSLRIKPVICACAPRPL